jgi:hypothetical protein
MNSKSRITAFQDKCLMEAKPKIRADLTDVVVPKVKAIFKEIRENKKHHDFFDENKFKEKIFNDVFDFIEEEIKKLEDVLKDSIVKVQRQALEN